MGPLCEAAGLEAAILASSSPAWPTLDLWSAVALMIAGVVTGAINVIAGGGSFLTLPLLIFFGLPPGIANGTNRVGILLQGVTAVPTFHRDGALDLPIALWAAVPSTLGAGLGTWLALGTDDTSFQRILATLMVVISLISFWRPKANKNNSGPRLTLLALGFFGVGVYGGFVQAGVGFLILAVTTYAGLDLVRGNAVKVLAVLAFTVLSLGIFASQGRVSWPHGLALAAGNAVGGVLGAKITVRQGDRWLRVAVTVLVLIFAAKLWIG